MPEPHAAPDENHHHPCRRRFQSGVPGQPGTDRHPLPVRDQFRADVPDRTLQGFPQRCAHHPARGATFDSGRIRRIAFVTFTKTGRPQSRPVFNYRIYPVSNLIVRLTSFRHSLSIFSEVKNTHRHISLTKTVGFRTSYFWNYSIRWQCELTLKKKHRGTSYVIAHRKILH